MAKLISSLEVIDKAFLMGNIDPSLISDTYIEVSQEEHIRPILTQDLYNLIVTENDSQTFTGSNQTLLNDYIKPALAFYVAADIIPHIAIRTTNKGIMTNTSETSQSATWEERIDIMTRYKEQGATMLEKMVRYLDDNTTTFPLYQNGSSATITTKLKAGIIM